MLLACIGELLEYGLHHRMPPARFASLIANPDTPTMERILADLKLDWHMILSMESKVDSAELLHGRCRFVTYQATRETMAALEKEDFHMCEEVYQLVQAWNPSIQSSSNLESIFGDMQSAISRSGRSDCGSLPNLMSVGIRGLENRMAEGSNTAEPLKLERADWHGKEVTALKSKLWMPSSAPACSSSLHAQSCCCACLLLATRNDMTLHAQNLRHQSGPRKHREAFPFDLRVSPKPQCPQHLCCSETVPTAAWRPQL